MKRLVVIFICLCLLSGCWRNPFSRIPKGNKGEATQRDTEKKKTTGTITGEIELPGPELPEDYEDKKPLKIKADGVDVELPAGTKGKLKIGAQTNIQTTSLTSMISSWKLNSAPVQLTVFGGILVAVGIGLVIFGMSKIGIACAGMGGSLIACAIMINNYPWVVLIVMGLALVAGGYFLYNQYKKKKIEGESVDQMMVLSKLCKLIERMPEDIIDKYIKEPLKEDDDSAVIREITRRARGI